MRLASDVVAWIGAGRRARWLFVLAGWGWAGLLMCPNALAGTVSVAPVTDATGYTRDVVTFAAFPSERNVLTATAVFDSTPSGVSWDFTDAGPTVVAGAGCVSVDAHTARCSSGPSSARVDLGDLDDQLSFTQRAADLLVAGPFFVDLNADGGAGDDTLSAPNIEIQVLRGGSGADRLFGGNAVPGDSNVLDGGPGDDLLVGGSGVDYLDGGGGRDRMFGRAGDDHFTDGDRDDASSDGAPGPDIVAGGRGHDEVSYEQRVRSVTVHLAAGRLSGEQGEGDELSSIEDAIGGQGADRLVGNSRHNILDGLGGHDRLIGGDGNDRLRPGKDSLSCGPGRDVVTRYNAELLRPARDDDPEISARDFVPPDCERVGYQFDDLLGTYPAYPPLDHKGAPHYNVSCPFTEDGVQKCNATVTIRQAASPHRLLARGVTKSDYWRDHRVTAPLTALGHRLSTRLDGVRSTIRIMLRTPGFFPRNHHVAWSIKLKVPPQGP